MKLHIDVSFLASNGIYRRMNRDEAAALIQDTLARVVPEHIQTVLAELDIEAEKADMLVTVE